MRVYQHLIFFWMETFGTGNSTNVPTDWIKIAGFVDTFGCRIGGKVSILHRRQSCIATHVFFASFSSRICRHNRRPLALHDHPTLDVSSIPGADSKVFGKMNLGILQSITFIAKPRSTIIKVNEACWRNPACTKATSIYIYSIYLKVQESPGYLPSK